MARTDTLFRRLIEDRSGLQTPDYRLSDLRRLVDEIGRSSGLNSPIELYQLLISPAGEHHLKRLIEGMTIGETHFFRNEAQFRLLRETILPRLIQQRQSTRRLRIWSAACSCGEEAYSLAILLHQLLPDLQQWSISLLGTDINSKNLEKASAALYRQWSMRQTSDKNRSTYFTPIKDGYQLRADIRRMVSFQQQNLVEQVSPIIGGRQGGFDLILCRNVLIYFSESTNRRIVQHLRSNLVDDGWFLVGHAEQQQLFNRTFTTHIQEGATAYRPLISVAEPPVHSISNPVISNPVISNPVLPGLPPVAPAQPTKTLPMLSGLEKINPTPPAMQALAYWKMGDVDGALRILTSLSPDSVQDGDTGYQIARIYAHRSQWDQALVWLDTALRNKPLLAAAHYLKGIVYCEIGEDANALMAFRRTLYADPHYVLAFVSQATILEKMGESQRADKALDNVARWLQSRQDDEQVTPEEEITVGGLRNLLVAKRLGTKVRNGMLH